MASIADLKKQSKTALNKLQSSIQSEQNRESSGNSYGDDRLWKPFFDKDKGTGMATVRFLPEPAGEDLPWIKLFSHGFKGPSGKWYIENSLTTMNQADPVGELNSRLWNSGIESDKDVARSQKRRISYYSNVLVIDDPAHPENNGKVFLYRYGQKIYEKLQELMVPQFEDEEPINPFDAWEGCDFTIRMRTVSGYVNYDKSSFSSPSAISTDDEYIESVWKKCHSLQELVSEKNFKSYDELKNRLFEVLGPTVGSGVDVIPNSSSTSDSSNVDSSVTRTRLQNNNEDDAEKTSEHLSEHLSEHQKSTESDDDVDEDLKFFETLATS